MKRWNHDFAITVPSEFIYNEKFPVSNVGNICGWAKMVSIYVNMHGSLYIDGDTEMSRVEPFSITSSDVHIKQEYKVIGPSEYARIYTVTLFHDGKIRRVISTPEKLRANDIPVRNLMHNWKEIE